MHRIRKNSPPARSNHPHPSIPILTVRLHTATGGGKKKKKKRECPLVKRGITGCGVRHCCGTVLRSVDQLQLPQARSYSITLTINNKGPPRELSGLKGGEAGTMKARGRRSILSLVRNGLYLRRVRSCQSDQPLVFCKLYIYIPWLLACFHIYIYSGVLYT